MFLDNWSLILIAGGLIYMFFKITKAIESLEDRVSDLEDKTSVLDGENNSNIEDDL